MNNEVYTKEQLYSMGPQRTFNNDAREAAFLLGGIGTGNISVGARGELRDWEIFNSPGKGNYLPYTFFAIRAEKEGEKPVAKVLESEIQPPYSKSHGFLSGEMAGLPRLRSSRMRGEYPFVWVDFEDSTLPVDVSMEAFTPFIPLNSNDSGIPGAIIRYKVKNTSDKPVKVSVIGSLANAVGHRGFALFGNLQANPQSLNEYRDEDGVRGLYYYTDLEESSLEYGSMCLMTRDSSVTYKTYWLSGGWCDGIHDLWDDFCDDGLLEKESVYEGVKSEMGESNLKVGSMGMYETLEPDQERVFEFIISWFLPNRIKAWDTDSCCCAAGGCETVKNYYATLFDDAWHAGRYLLENLDRLEGKSRDFHRALFGSTLPDYVIDAIASNITVCRSTTCFRIEDGTFLGWEGTFDQRGCCEGSCTHVWNYAQTLAFLFPDLEQSMRKVEFNLETDENGKMSFRTRRVFGKEPWDFLPATDGQMGTIIRLYREWKISGDDELIKTVWEKASKALDFAFEYWDSDGDFVLDSQQHNTYDIEFYGPNSLTNSMFFAALKAGAEIADYLGDEQHAAKYREALEKGSKRMDELLWGGEYYIQMIDDVNKYRYQYGKGCLSDQILGQLLAHVAGLGYILPEEHVRRAVKSIFDYNFRTSFRDHHNVQRTYVLNDEKGLLLCSWPKGGRPKLPFVYADEVWTGIEYHVAAHLIYEGFVDEGLTIVRAVRERHDGYRRNPWNEVECGHHYARSMASWALLTALSGFKYDMVEGTMSFKPAINSDDFKTFWSTGKGWGIYTQKKDPETGEIVWDIEVLYGSLEGVSVNE